MEYSFLFLFFIINEMERRIFFNISKKLLIGQYLSCSCWVSVLAYRKRKRVDEK
jgi:hypothetical protein